jgi:mannonate dehydratase
MNRRVFLQKGMGAVLGLALFANRTRALAGPDPVPLEPAVKLGVRLPPRLEPGQLALLRQLDLGWCRVDINPEDAEEERLSRICDTYAAAGVNSFAVTCRFGQDDRNGLEAHALERKIAQEQKLIRLLGRRGIKNYEIAFNRHTPGSQIYSTSTGYHRGIEVRRFELDKLREIEARPATTLSAAEVTDAFDHYISRLLPVAEEAGVRIALHPDDPPIDVIGGVARIFHHIDHFKRVFARHPSPNFGILFCVGTWAEGGPAMGADVTEAIRYFASQKRLFSVHFRNVSSPLPVFEETFMDDGYLDMQKVMNTLVNVQFDGLLVADHIPHFSGETDRAPQNAAGRYESPFYPLGIAYSAGAMHTYLKTALRRAAAG